ncbi:MAG TPA: FMN-dependent NADH-azoreductase [Acidiferrobacteraceae bacterium]|nr:FMN-dependent NADH-azoreductase [Acidiferrobacteraceae bacterium]
MNNHTQTTAPASRQDIRVLRIDASGRYEGSVTRQLADEVIDALGARFNHVHVSKRDVAQGVPFVDEDWITANFTDDEDRNDEQRKTLAHSDSLVQELKDADMLVIGAPIYNFGIPASLKAWIDMTARARLTFRYTESGPVGLLKNKKAYLVVASGGVPVGSSLDFATPYLRQALGFVGITDVQIIAAEQLNTQGETGVQAARTQIAEILGKSSTVSSQAQTTT